MTRIKSVWFKGMTPLACLPRSLSATIVCEDGIWFTAVFGWNEQNQRWERAQ